MKRCQDTNWIGATAIYSIEMQPVEFQTDVPNDAKVTSNVMPLTWITIETNAPLWSSPTTRSGSISEGLLAWLTLKEFV
jgi:hypothetical protein